MNRIFSLMAAQPAVPLFHTTGTWYWSFWLGAIFSAFAFVLNIIYLFLETRLPAGMRLPTPHQNVSHTSLKTRFTAHAYHLSTSILLLPASFWLLAILQILQSGVVSS